MFLDIFIDICYNIMNDIYNMGQYYLYNYVPSFIQRGLNQVHFNGFFFIFLKQNLHYIYYDFVKKICSFHKISTIYYFSQVCFSLKQVSYKLFMLFYPFLYIIYLKVNSQVHVFEQNFKIFQLYIRSYHHCFV